MSDLVLGDILRNDAEVLSAVEAMDFHVWNPTNRLCACGAFFEASSATVYARKAHVVREVLRAGLQVMLDNAGGHS